MTQHIPAFTATLILLLLMTACSGSDSDNRSDAGTRTVSDSNSDITMEQPDNSSFNYNVTRINQPVEINSEWDKEPWRDIPSLRLTNYMGDEPDHRPNTEVKVAYDEEAVYVIFLVDDQYVRCVVEEYQGPVYTDSCVEFFFVPGTDLAEGYFNLETNCGGTALFHFQKDNERNGQVKIPRSDFDTIDLAHSLPEVVDPLITEPVTWTLEYRLPIDILTQYSEVSLPDSGVEWRANFYKIGDRTSHPHWLTWSFVDHPRPNFHLPEYFGTLTFE